MAEGVVVLELFIALGLVGVNAFFVVAEFALVSVRPSRIDELVAQGNSLAKVARHAISDPDRFIAATQLGITLASLGLGWIGEPAFAGLIAPLVAAIPAPWNDVVVHSIAGGIAFALITFLHVVLGELAPKSIALQNPERASLVVARPILWTETLFRPFIWLLNGAGNGLLRLIGFRRVSGHRTVHSVEEFRILVRQSQEGGAIEAQQEEMLQNVFLFGERQVNEVMIPRTDVVGIEQDATVRDLLQAFASASHARFPVFEEDLDNIVGILAIKDVVLAMAEDPARAEMPIRSLVRPALFVPGSVAVGALLARMRATHDQMAVILDEYGGTAGIVTLEGLVEEIVGQVSDELVVQEQPFVRVNDTTVEVDGQMRVEDANQELGLALPEGEDYETVAGLILYYLQRVPHEGDELQQPGVVLRVMQMRGRKIERVQVRRGEDPPERMKR